MHPIVAKVKGFLEFLHADIIDRHERLYSLQERMVRDTVTDHVKTYFEKKGY